MTPDQITDAARRLFAAETSREQIGLLSVQYPELDMQDAYKIQAALIAQKMAAGAKGIGWKIGLTSKAMQYALNIDIPDSGILLDDMAFVNGATIPKNRFIQPRVEAEIAFVMKSDLSGGDITQDDVINATDYIAPALEILDTRILRVDPKTGATRKVFDTIADNAANAGIVMGDQKLNPAEIDMRWMGAIASRNNEVEETGLGAGVLNHPALGIVWLVNRLAKFGDGIKAGDIVLSGSFIRPIEAPSGSVIHADYGPYGHLTCTFA